MYKTGFILAIMQVVVVIVAAIMKRFKKAPILDATPYPTMAVTERTVPLSQGDEQSAAQRNVAEGVCIPTYGAAEISPVPNALQGLTFTITGRIGVRREAFGAFIERQGGTWHQRPRKDTQYIIVGHTGEHGITGKLQAALDNGAREITAEEVCTMCGVTMEQLRDDSATYEDESRLCAAASLRRVQRNMQRTTSGLAEGIRIQVQSDGNKHFTDPVRVMTEDDEVVRCVSIELNRTASNRLEYILHTTEGDVVSLDEVHPAFMADLYAAVLAA